MKFRFDGLWPSPLSSSNIFQIAEASTVGIGISLAQQTLSELKNGLQWLGSVRQFPSRIVEYLGSAPRNISYNGAGVGEILVQDMLANGPLLREVSQWYQDSFKRKLDVQQLQDGRYSLTLEPLAMTGDRAVNLADTGEGIAQVLPVLVAAAMANRGGPTDPTILAIEQPELHLHPAVHDKLAKYLCDIAATKKPRMLIETHSENFLLGVQIQIVKREIAPEDVLIYWVMQGDDGASRVQRITLDKDGYPDDFPEGVFEEDLDLAQRFRELRKSVKP
jgi:predicted ATPase